jgi:hypothetical protein
MIKAVEGDNWSQVIDQQTQQATGAPSVPAPSSSNGHSNSSTKDSASKTGPAGASSSGPMVSPFAQPQVCHMQQQEIGDHMTRGGQVISSDVS